MEHTCLDCLGRGEIIFLGPPPKLKIIDDSLGRTIPKCFNMAYYIVDYGFKILDDSWTCIHGKISICIVCIGVSIPPSKTPSSSFLPSPPPPP